MIKKLAVCAVLFLLIIPAFALAAGQGAGETGKSTSAANGQQAQQTARETCSQVQVRSCLQQGSGASDTTASGQMLQVRTREQVREMLMTMAENQTHPGQGSGNGGGGQGNGSVSMQAAGTAAGLLQQGDGSMIRAHMVAQKRLQTGDVSGNSTGTADQLRDRIRDMARNQIRLKDGSCCQGLTL